MRHRVRQMAIAAAFILAATACAGDGAQSTTVPQSDPTTSQTSPATSAPSGGEEPSTTGGEETSTTAGPAQPPPHVEGPAAPDFTFALSDGSSFSLSDEQKPVYLVFWAEW